jgi:Uma2 family endonuclease
MGTAHFWTVAELTQWLTLHLAKRAFVVCQGPLSLPDSEPEPDIMVLKPASDRQRLPEPADVLLLIEVADSSLRYDRTCKLPLYASSGIPEVWLIDLNARVAEVHRQPVGTGYETVTTPNPLIPLAFPDLTISLDDILP